ncbi:MAG: hypothetical protein ACYC8T_11590 [Myxococcaceae bacterium]
MLGFKFHEVMEGTLQREGETFDRPFRFEFEVVAPSALGFLTSVVAEMRGTARIDGLAKDGPAEGTLEMSPFLRRQLRYRFTLKADDGREYRFDGQKSINYLRPLTTWTTLPGTLYDPEGKVWGTALLRFVMKRELVNLLTSFRPVRDPVGAFHG